jgi:hypothetical protein
MIEREFKGLFSMAKLIPLLFSDDGTSEETAPSEPGPFDMNRTASITDVLQLLKIKEWASENNHDLEGTPLCHHIEGSVTSAKAFVLIMRELEVQKVDGVVVENIEKILQAGWQKHFIAELARQKKKLYSARNNGEPVKSL